MTQQEFIEKMEWFGGFYGVQKLAKAQMQVWYDIFKDVTAYDFLAALVYHIKTDHFNGFPAPGKITTALETVEEMRKNVKPTYPEFTTLWCRVVSFFPGQHEYEYFPPTEDEEAWKALYDRVVRIPSCKREGAVQQVIGELEGKCHKGGD